MKKQLCKLFFIFGIAISLTSCYTYTFNVGDGAQSGATVKGKNHYFIGGLAQGQQSDHTELAGNATDYTVTIQHTFVDGLIQALTLGIYTPTSTIIQK